MTGVVLAGHYHSHLDRLIALYEENKPTLPHDVLVVCNHPEPYKTHLPIIHTENDSMRDIGMYRAAFQHTGWEWAFLMNDDVVILDGDWYGEAAKFINNGAEIVGAIPAGFSYVMAREGRIKVWQDRRGEDAPLPDYLHSDEVYEKWRWLSHIRTHAFACTADYFERVWQCAKEQVHSDKATTFESCTLKAGAKPHFLSSYMMVVDSNHVPYLEWFEK